MNNDELRRLLKVIRDDGSLTPSEKNRKCQDLMMKRTANGSTCVPVQPKEHNTDKQCKHYEKTCSNFYFSCCDVMDPCHRCHIARECCVSNAKPPAITSIECNRCGHRQDPGPACTQCEEVFSKSYCGQCKIWTAAEIHHCDFCGFCRVGNADHIFHCHTCEACFSKELRGSHICAKSKLKGESCPLCLESVHSSQKSSTILKCGHVVHGCCWANSVKKGDYRCPTCRKSLFDMGAYWQDIKWNILAQPLPPNFFPLQAGDLVLSPMGSFLIHEVIEPSKSSSPINRTAAAAGAVSSSSSATASRVEERQHNESRDEDYSNVDDEGEAGENVNDLNYESMRENNNENNSNQPIGAPSIMSRESSTDSNLSGENSQTGRRTRLRAAEPAQSPADRLNQEYISTTQQENSNTSNTTSMLTPLTRTLSVRSEAGENNDTVSRNESNAPPTADLTRTLSRTSAQPPSPTVSSSQITMRDITGGGISIPIIRTDSSRNASRQNSVGPSTPLLPPLPPASAAPSSSSSSSSTTGLALTRTVSVVAEEGIPSIPNREMISSSTGNPSQPQRTLYSREAILAIGNHMTERGERMAAVGTTGIAAMEADDEDDDIYEREEGEESGERIEGDGNSASTSSTTNPLPPSDDMNGSTLLSLEPITPLVSSTTAYTARDAALSRINSLNHLSRVNSQNNLMNIVQDNVYGFSRTNSGGGVMSGRNELNNNAEARRTRQLRNSSSSSNGRRGGESEFIAFHEEPVAGETMYRGELIFWPLHQYERKKEPEEGNKEKKNSIHGPPSYTVKERHATATFRESCLVKEHMYVSVYCYDCEVKSHQVPFHYFGLECGVCHGYNTTRM